MRRLGRALAGAVPATLAGGFAALAVIRLSEPHQSRLGALLIGGLYGLAVVGLIRLFRVAPWAYVLVGFLAGPVPLVLLLPGNHESNGDELGVLWMVTSLLGAIIGALECARIQRLRQDERSST
ncbi:MAG: hypothetical protein AAF682_28150 [Planctomycetota bacterium]